jgi:hypothetical protein
MRQEKGKDEAAVAATLCPLEKTKGDSWKRSIPNKL